MHRLLRTLFFIAAVPTAGMLYQWTGSRRDRKRLLPPENMIDVDDGQDRRSMFLSQMGAGEPTVIFESGIAATSQNWTHLQQAVSNFTRTVTYDRSGLGWSSPSATERTPSNIVRELRTLLQKAGLPPPYLLVGHSFGGLIVRRFAAEHPHEVVGVVLVDPMRPDEWANQSEAQRDELARGNQLTSIGIPCARLGLSRLVMTSLLCGSGRVARILGRLSGSRGRQVMDRLTCEVGKMPRETWPIVVAHWSNPEFYRGMASYVRAVPASAHEMHTAKPIEGIPVILLTPATAEPLSPDALRRIGASTQQVIAEKSGHWIHLDEPSLVLDAIRHIIDEIHSAAPEHVEAIQN